MRQTPRRSLRNTSELPPRDFSSEAERLDEITGSVMHDTVTDPAEIAERLCLTPFDMQECLK
jgi:hypothetical protein